MDCLIVDDEELSRNMIQHFVEQTESLNLVAACSSAMEAVNVLSKKKVDLIFLDIEMPQMNGFELIESMAEPPLIIMVTSKKDHAVEAFDHDVVDYLIKPLSYPRFLKAVARARQANSLNEDEGFFNDNELFVRSDAKIIKISLDEIYYIEALADYIMIFTQNNKFIVHSTMKGFQGRLPKRKFARVHRSYIINTNKIETIENLFIVMNNKYIPIGALYKDEFMKRLNLY
jgi:DNA-binding LytR/AlgR family response regulator